MSTVNQRLRDEALAHSLFQSRYAHGVAKEKVAILNQYDAELTARLFGKLEKVNPQHIEVKQLARLLACVQEVNQQAMSTLYLSLSEELLAFAEHEAGYHCRLVDKLLPDVVLHRYPLAIITAEQVYAAAMAQPFQGRLLRDWVSHLESDRFQRINNAVKNGFLLGDTIEQITRKVRGSRAKQYQDGVLDISRKNLTSVVKTAVNHVSAVARDKFAENNAAMIDRKQWLSTLDNKTSSPCVIRDRLCYTLAGQPLGHKIPYLQGPGRLHFCCRSTETLVIKSWRALGIDLDELDPGTRASLDGQVPADTTYADWLQQQPYARQVQVLGKTRAKMLREEGRRPDDFFSDKGEWLTLEQLRETLHIE
ncbi:hypothetical protein SK355_09990 [Candidatus Fukatsuia symbiotica]|uniref:Phage head morphogenesis domain-containing protein n=2 Tax=Candidatus Fukatsuia TaxID=1927833 RepID=A0A2U8I3J3_9GAMM|nr:hypothetical protein [Candidatus Fukatsuia symbiotica]AWK13535.1 hypothetical protein CCS41_01895 [Candidatus Fukatsuia symbiotica]AWK13697.1 hypothetical protein CCS41_03115 [Candidatus Fukatsuia symbiotica]MEA9445529.1 hypothetical protein [Candidatus Fukatsuia symbiotica]